MCCHSWDLRESYMTEQLNNKVTLYVYTTSLFISVNGHLGCFHFLAIVNCPSMNIGVYASFWMMFFSEYMPKSVISWSYGSPIFSFLENFHSVLHSDLTNFHSHQQYRSIPFSPHLLQQYLLADYFKASHFDWCKVISHCRFDLCFSNN